MSAPSSVAALSLLPALSVVLGLPLCHSSSSTSNIGTAEDDNGDHNRNPSSPKDEASSSSSLTTTVATKSTAALPSQRSQQKYEDDFAERAKNNASRIYARRVINRARFEREWASSSTSSAKDDVIAGRNNVTRDKHNCSLTSSSNDDDPSTNKSEDEGEEDNQKWQSWKDDLLSETLVSLIRLQEQMKRVKSFTNSTIIIDGSNNNIKSDTLFSSNNSNHQLLSQLGIIASNSTNLLQFNKNIAYCETTPSSKQRTLNEYNSLVVTATSSNTDNNDVKPAEWSDDIDLVQRRLEFGQEISPLSNTTRLERWSLAVKRVISLGMLVAPLGVMIPMNLVLGRCAGVPQKKKKNGDGDGDGGEGSKSNTSSAAAASTVVDNQKNKSSSSQKQQQQQQQQQLSTLQHYHKHLTQQTWDYALWAIETAGPTYIKLVQWASTRNDLFSPEFVGHFSKLQDETRGHSWKETEATLVRAYGVDWKSVLSFDSVIDDEDDESDGVEGGRLKRVGGGANRDRQRRLETQSDKDDNGGGGGGGSSSSQPTIPIGSGCVAQVYKARLCTHHGLHPAGTSVAVKVQHPNILEKVCLDFYIMNKLASMLEYIPYLNLDYLSMKDSVDQFRDIMLPQLDLRVEAHNLERFRRDFEGENQIAFPEPLQSLTSREVLVERFVEGEPMLNYVLKEDDDHSKRDREELATIGLETVMKMIFLHDFVHADLHPGNMIVDRNKSVRGNPLRVHMIDCGLTVELGERDHMNLVKILGSLIKRDGYSAGALMVDTAKKCQGTELDVEMFCKGMQKICIDDEENNFLESVGDYITDICYLACKHKVKLEAAFINVALACEIMEGLASSLYPDMKVQSVALPLVLKAEMMHGLKGLHNPFWGSK